MIKTDGRYFCFYHLLLFDCLLKERGMELFFKYILFINILGFLLMGIDKGKARRGAWRISEKTLLLTAIIGGAFGVWLGMETFRHKTKHWYFKYLIPLFFVVQVVFLAFLYMK